MESAHEHQKWALSKDASSKMSKLIRLEDSISEVSDDIINYEQEERSTEFESPRSKQHANLNIQEPFDSKHTSTLDIKRTVTIDLATSCDSQISLHQGRHFITESSQHSIRKDKRLAHYSPSKISDSTADTFQQAFTNFNHRNSRYINTPSPTKLRRDKCQFSSIGDNVMNSVNLQNFKIKPEINNSCLSHTNTNPVNKNSHSKVNLGNHNMIRHNLFETPRTPNVRKLL